MARPHVEQPRETDPAEALMREVGVQLRAVRLERDEDLDEVAEYLRIKPVYLYAIERGDMSVMPGRTYALGFLRSYADYLGFDGEDLIVQIKSTVDNLTGTTRFRLRAPLHESRLPKMPLLVLSAAMMAGIYAGWTFLHRPGEATYEIVAEVPPDLRREVEATGAPPAATTTARQEPADTAPERPAAAPATDTATAQGAGGPAEETPAQTAEATPPGPSGRAPALAAGAADAAPPAAGTGPRPAEAAAAGDDGAALDGLPRETPQLAELANAPEAEDPANVEPSAGPAVPPAADDQQPALAGATPEDGDVAGPAPDEPPATAGGDVAVAATAGEDAPGPPAAGEGSALLTAAALVAEAGDWGPGDPQIYEPVNADARVILRAVGPSWVQIRSESGDYLRTRTLVPGDTFLVPNRDDLVLWTGNAGAIEYVVDGRSIRPLGGEGSVMRDIPLGPDALLRRAREQG